MFDTVLLKKTTDFGGRDVGICVSKILIYRTLLCWLYLYMCKSSMSCPLIHAPWNHQRQAKSTVDTPQKLKQIKHNTIFFPLTQFKLTKDEKVTFIFQLARERELNLGCETLFFCAGIPGCAMNALMLNQQSSQLYGRWTDSQKDSQKKIKNTQWTTSGASLWKGEVQKISSGNMQERKDSESEF